MDEFYKEDGIVVRRSKLSDIDAMKDRLRESDVKEIWASHNHRPEEAIRRCVEDTLLSCTIENGRPIGIFGISTDQVLGNKATIWMLATDDLNKINRRFVRNSRVFVLMMLRFYPLLENFVHVNNKKSILWLRWLGAVIEEARPYGCEGELFHRFYFLRDY